MNIKISQIDHNSAYLNDIVALGDTNKATLGLFPKEAYRISASKKWIIAAVDQNSGKVVGYLLYSTSRRKMLVSIVHLCIDSSYRNQGITKLLFNELKRITQDGYLSVRVRCRVDYLSNKIWPKLGFIAVGEMDGRGKKNTRLTIWKYEYEHLSLFTYASLQNEDLKVKVVIDANVFYQLQNPEIPENEESLPLIEPWLDVELYITPEMFNEINRNKDENKRELSRKFANSFSIVDVKTSQTEFQKIQEDLIQLFPLVKPSDDSDMRQLAYAIAAKVPFFVTRDGVILARSDDIFERFDIQIMRPSDVILLQDELLRGDDYTSSRLAGSQIRIEKVRSQKSVQLVEKFLSPHEETKGAFNQKLQTVLGNVASIDTFVVLNSQDEELGLVSYSRQVDDQINIPIFRVGNDDVCQYIAKYIVNNVVLAASAENRNTIKIEEKYLSDKIILALRENGFLQSDNTWYRAVFPEMLSKQVFISSLENLKWKGKAEEILSNIGIALRSETSQSVLLEIERSFWPLKIEEVGIPTFIVPIRPIWAMHLFDVDIAGQDLFGGEPSLILNAENVYYRSSVPKVLSAPGRILWYVSAGNTRYRGAMHLRASSYLDEVDIGKPKQLFSKYKKLGVYKWGDVFNGVAGGDVDQDIMAFKFSKTEVFRNPIPLQKLQEIWKSQDKNFNPITPLSVTNETFFSLYNLGMRGK